MAPASTANAAPTTAPTDTTNPAATNDAVATKPKKYAKTAPGKYITPKLGEIKLVKNIRSDLNIDGLVDTIREEGVLQPVILVKNPNESEPQKYILRAGYRRYHSVAFLAKEQGRTPENAEIPAMYYPDVDVTNGQALKVAIVENVQREDMNALDRARSFKDLLTELGIPQQELARTIGKSEGYISQHLGLLKLPNSVQKWVRDGVIEFAPARLLNVLHRNPEELKEAVKQIQGAIETRQKRRADLLKAKEEGKLAKDDEGAELTGPLVGSLDVEPVVRQLKADIDRREREAEKAEKEKARAKEAAKAEASGKKPSAKAAQEEEKDPDDQFIEDLEEVKIKVQKDSESQERFLRKLLVEQGRVVLSKKTPHTRAEAEQVLRGIKLACGIKD